MSKKEWGNACWFLFHGLATKIKDEYFNEMRDDIWKFINLICSNLPCYECRKHAIELMGKTNKSTILSSKRNLEMFLFDFHNMVNKRNNTRVMSIDEYDTMYKSINIRNVITNFINKFFSNANNSKLMLDAMHRRLFYDEFVIWIKNNINKFNLQPNSL
jgi:hypothetical protein